LHAARADDCGWAFAFGKFCSSFDKSDSFNFNSILLPSPMGRGAGGEGVTPRGGGPACHWQLEDNDIPRLATTSACSRLGQEHGARRDFQPLAPPGGRLPYRVALSCVGLPPGGAGGCIGEVASLRADGRHVVAGGRRACQEVTEGDISDLIRLQHVHALSGKCMAPGGE
jgi:hypothetical protein